jgi:hypothetical protein
VAGLLGSLALVSAVMLIRTGELPDLSLLPYWSKFLGGAAFGLLPMPSWGLHWAMYLTYVGALLLAVVRFLRSAPNPALTAMLAFGGIFGLATGQYFAGRSDPTLLMSLFPVWALALAPLAWAVAVSLRDARLDHTRLRRMIIPAVAVMAGFGVMVSGLNRFPLPWHEADRLSNTGEAVYDQPFEQQFIEDQTEPGEPILLMATRVDHRVAERAGVENVSPWGSYSLFSPKEVTRALDNLEEEGGTKLFHPTADSSALTPVELMFYERGYRIVRSEPFINLDMWVLH